MPDDKKPVMTELCNFWIKTYIQPTSCHGPFQNIRFFFILSFHGLLHFPNPISPYQLSPRMSFLILDDGRRIQWPFSFLLGGQYLFLNSFNFFSWTFYNDFNVIIIIYLLYFSKGVYRRDLYTVKTRYFGACSNQMVKDESLWGFLCQLLE